jgi:uncharacterized peroxidase-related enzyme
MVQLMAHITLKNEQLPGIVGLFDYRPETAKPLNELAEILLRGPSTLTRGERELIASSVSNWNQCHFCHSSHGAAAAAHLQMGIALLDDIKADLKQTKISLKLRALLDIAKQVQQGGRQVTQTTIQAAREQGATDLEIHDTVLIAAAFCMYNRYVDGLGTWAPEAKDAYVETGKMLATVGYVNFRPPAEKG